MPGMRPIRYPPPPHDEFLRPHEHATNEFLWLPGLVEHGPLPMPYPLPVASAMAGGTPLHHHLASSTHPLLDTLHGLHPRTCRGDLQNTQRTQLICHWRTPLGLLSPQTQRRHIPTNGCHKCPLDSQLTTAPNLLQPPPPHKTMVWDCKWPEAYLWCDLPLLANARALHALALGEPIHIPLKTMPS